MRGDSAAPPIPHCRSLSLLVERRACTLWAADSDTYGGTYGGAVTVTVYHRALDAAAAARFEAAVEIATRLGQHPNLVTIYGSGRLPDGGAYVVSDGHERATAEGLLLTAGVLDVERVLRMGIALAGALETAHRAGVVHGGVSPALVLLSADGEPVLTEVALGEFGQPAGISAFLDHTIPYHAPPEVLESTELSPATDVYSLASVVYTLLVGDPPHASHGVVDSTASLLLRILQMPMPTIQRSDVPPGLEDTLRTALSHVPGKRPQQVLELAWALQEAQRLAGMDVTEPVVLDLASGAPIPVTPASPSPAGGGVGVAELPGPAGAPTAGAAGAALAPAAAPPAPAPAVVSDLGAAGPVPVDAAAPAAMPAMPAVAGHTAPGADALAPSTPSGPADPMPPAWPGPLDLHTPDLPGTGTTAEPSGPADPNPPPWPGPLDLHTPDLPGTGTTPEPAVDAAASTPAAWSPEAAAWSPETAAPDAAAATGAPVTGADPWALPPAATDDPLAGPGDAPPLPHHDGVPPLRPRRDGRSQPVGHELGDGPREDGYRTDHLDPLGSLPAPDLPDDVLATPAAFGPLAPWAPPGPPPDAADGHNGSSATPPAPEAPVTGPEVAGRPDPDAGRLPKRGRRGRAGDRNGTNGTPRPHADEASAAPAGHNGSGGRAGGAYGAAAPAPDTERPWWQIFGATVPSARSGPAEGANGSANGSTAQAEAKATPTRTGGRTAMPSVSPTPPGQPERVSALERARQARIERQRAAGPAAGTGGTAAAREPAPAPAPQPEAPARSRPPALPVIVLVAVVVLLGIGGAYLVVTGEDATDTRADAMRASSTTTAPTTTTTIDDGPPAYGAHDLQAAVTNDGGVQLDWEGADGSYVVRVLAADADPRELPAGPTTALMVPSALFTSSGGLCFDVAGTGPPGTTTPAAPAGAPATSVAAAPATTATTAAPGDDAAGERTAGERPIACVRGGDPATVRR